jgi:hypothetical protein
MYVSGLVSGSAHLALKPGDIVERKKKKLHGIDSVRVLVMEILCFKGLFRSKYHFFLLTGTRRRSMLSASKEQEKLPARMRPLSP